MKRSVTLTMVGLVVFLFSVLSYGEPSFIEVRRSDSEDAFNWFLKVKNDSNDRKYLIICATIVTPDGTTFSHRFMPATGHAVEANGTAGTWEGFEKKGIQEKGDSFTLVLELYDHGKPFEGKWMKEWREWGEVVDKKKVQCKVK